MFVRKWVLSTYPSVITLPKRKPSLVVLSAAKQAREGSRVNGEWGSSHSLCRNRNSPYSWHPANSHDRSSSESRSSDNTYRLPTTHVFQSSALSSRDTFPTPTRTKRCGHGSIVWEINRGNLLMGYALDLPKDYLKLACASQRTSGGRGYPL